MTTSETPAGAEKTFQHLVRDALMNLNDPSRLETHPLAARAPRSVGVSRGKWLCRLLLDSIGTLRPTSGTATTSRPWRTYRILELRFVDGLEVAEIVDELAVTPRRPARCGPRRRRDRFAAPRGRDRLAYGVILTARWPGERGV